MADTAPPRRLGLILAVIVYIVDQAVKYAVIGPLALPHIRNIDILPFFDLTWVENYGVSMGFLTASSNGMRWALVGLTAAISLAVLAWMWRERSRADVLALGLVLGGALGNITDRTRFGYVVDYADLHFGEWRPFLVFNVSDAAITIGVVILLARALLVRDGKKSAEDDDA
ncbi:signal peptidase II [Sphingomonas flavalba]|uniref:signal peptidase II n=1 Tax=Sphingomonas flavalba TaxID=2559804 RepID=UPI00109DBBCA|nr:signal peptidase II [Sphingomonas flavalba]